MKQPASVPLRKQLKYYYGYLIITFLVSVVYYLFPDDAALFWGILLTLYYAGSFFLAAPLLGIVIQSLHHSSLIDILKMCPIVMFSFFGCFLLGGCRYLGKGGFWGEAGQTLQFSLMFLGLFLVGSLAAKLVFWVLEKLPFRHKKREE